MLNYEDVYKKMLEEKKEMEDGLITKRKKRYRFLCSTVALIEHPTKEDFLERVSFVKRNGIHLYNLVATSNAFFPDEASIYLWYSFLVSDYLNNKMTEEEERIFLDMYQSSLNEENFYHSILYLQMVLKLNDKEKFCQFLGIRPYLYNSLRDLKCDKKQLLFIRNHLSSKDLSSFSPIEQNAITHFLFLLLEKSRNMVDIKEKRRPALDKENFSNRIEEVLRYLEQNPTSFISSDIPFSDGANMGEWYHNLYKRYNFYQDDDKLEIQRGMYQVLKRLYNPKTIPLHENISLDYGSSLRRVLSIYLIDLSQIATTFKIPKPILLSILENKIIPNQDFIDAILSFLKDLSITNDYQKEFVEDAIDIYEKLKELSLESEPLSYVLYPASKEEEYLKSWNAFDSSILAKLKEINYDWYMKCITYFYICKEKQRKPLRDEFFYDGTYCYKWLTSQRRTLLGKSGHNINEYQKAMLNIILQEVDLIQYQKEEVKNIEKPILENMGAILTAIEESVSSYGKILPDLSFNQINLCYAWKIICQPLLQMEVPYSKETLTRIKTIRQRIISKNKKQINTFYSINFGYELACFFDSLHLSLHSLSKQISLSTSALALYSSNKALPNLEHTKVLLSFLDKLDLSLYRKDQMEDIVHFREVLCSLEQYLKEQDEIVKKRDFQILKGEDDSFTGELLKDIPISYLKEIHDTDIAWYEEFKTLYKDIYKGAKEALVILPMRRWYKNEVHKASLGNSSPIKEKLLRYLYFLYQKSCTFKKESDLLPKFISLSNFVYEKERNPFYKEFLLVDGTDGNKFYQSMKRSLYNDFCNHLYPRESYYKDLPDSLKEQMKLLIQYVASCSRKKKKTYQMDRIEGECLFLGERLENICICLGFSKDAFIKKMKWDRKEVYDLYSNRISLRRQHIEDLLDLFEEMKSQKLRKDQLEEMQAFIQVLMTKKLDEGFSLKFCPKE